MSKIRILPDQLANQIAAGEVVERPASVVKELLENSLDAGADHIEIEVEGGGTRLIRIVDNGEGMDEDDVLLCLERHGTSKIEDQNDLNAIQTLGFRGEAIPSISSVSKLTITSRRKENELGTALFCNYGSIKKVHETGTRVGTTIEINNLFGNTPARRKFLRTKRTELAHIDDTIRNYCLARPDVSFVFRIDGREVIRLESDTDLQSRLAILINYSGDFIEINSKPSPDSSIRVTGLLVSPESSSPTAARLRIFVNNRAVKDRMIIHAVNEGMRSFLLKGKSPAGVIKIEIPPESIDVNVHPAKHEIRFRDSRIIHTKVSDAVRNAMVEHQQHVRNEIFSTKSLGEPPQRDDREPTSMPGYDIPETSKHSQPGSLLNSHSDDNSSTMPSPSEPVFSAQETAAYASSLSPAVSLEKEFQEEPIHVEDLLVIGSFKDLYIFCRTGDKLIVIDQHAAHERLLFEELKSQFSRGKIASQQLMFPVTLELSVFQSQLVEKNLDKLENIGFSVREFGGNTWILGSVPALVQSGNPQDLFTNLLEQFGSERTMSSEDKFTDILSTMACKAAVKSGDHLADQEIRGLLQKMVKADLFSHCPHGRPVVKILDSNDIKKWFYRT